MALNINSFKTKSTFTPMDAGTYPAVCCGVVDLGVQITAYDGKEKETSQLQITWEFPDELIEYNGEMKPRTMHKIYTASVNEKARLRLDLKNWRGRDFTAEELRDFNIANVLGASCLITVTQTDKNGTVYSNVGGISKAMKGMEVKPPSKKLHFDIDDESTYPTFAELPEWVQDKINDSITFTERGILLDRDGNKINRLSNIPVTANVQQNEEMVSAFTAVDDDTELPF